MHFLLRAILLYTGIALLVVVCAVGSDSVGFAVIGDFGSGSANEAAVAAMVAQWIPDFVVTTGDNSYGTNSIDFNIGHFYSQYIGDYTGIYGAGADTNRFIPSLGNHDYADGGGLTAYLNYFSLPGAGVLSSLSSNNERYYDVIIEPVHLFIVNSNILEPSGISSTSAQAQWLRNQLETSVQPWKIVVMHHAPFSSSTSHGSTPVMQWPYEEWGADLLLSGHDHTYERIHRDDDGDGNQFLYFVNGLGGRSIYGFPVSGFVAGSMARYNGNYGAMVINASHDTLRSYFWSISGYPPGTLIDSVILINRNDCCVVAGDANNSGSINILDITFLISYLYKSGAVSNCPDGMNADGDGPINIIDVVRLIDFLYKGGSGPACPL